MWKGNKITEGGKDQTWSRLDCRKCPSRPTARWSLSCAVLGFFFRMGRTRRFASEDCDKDKGECARTKLARSLEAGSLGGNSATRLVPPLGNNALQALKSHSVQFPQSVSTTGKIREPDKRNSSLGPPVSELALPLVRHRREWCNQSTSLSPGC